LKREAVSNNITDIESLMPHRLSEVVCLKCLHRWIAVRPESVLLKDLECENCGQGYVIETGEVINQ